MVEPLSILWERGLINLLLAAYLPADDERIMEHLHTALAVFEECGDDLLLAATLADSAGMHGGRNRELDAWALANVRRTCEAQRLGASGEARPLDGTQ